MFYHALKADQQLMAAVSGRVKSTCFEVSPEEIDNTPTPCLIVGDDGLQNDDTTKDTEWESEEDRVQASVEIDADSPKEVKRLLLMVRRAIARYMTGVVATESQQTGDAMPELIGVQTSGVAWDWMKPCYHETISYQCVVENHLYDED